MSRVSPRQVGPVLLILGLAGGAVLWPGGPGSPLGVWSGESMPPLGVGLYAVAGGIILSMGDPRAISWLHAVSICLLAGVAASMVIAPFFQPFDLTWTEFRLLPGTDVTMALTLFGALIVLLVIVGTLGQAAARDLVLAAGLRRPNWRMAARIGVALVFLPAALLWLTLHGQSKALAEQLALQQLGPGYRYQLRWLGGERIAGREAVRATVLAWNATEIRTVLIHWQGR